MTTRECAFCVMGIGETVTFAVIASSLHRTTAFFGITNSAQGAGSILAGLTVSLLLRRAGEARTVGLSLACFAFGSVCNRGAADRDGCLHWQLRTRAPDASQRDRADCSRYPDAGSPRVRHGHLTDTLKRPAT